MTNSLQEIKREAETGNFRPDPAKFNPTDHYIRGSGAPAILDKWCDGFNETSTNSEVLLKFQRTEEELT